MNSRWRHMWLALVVSMGLLALAWLPAALKADFDAARAVAAPAAPGDVVINEVAWAGTAASTADEWIELYNNTPYSISLTDWHLVDNDNLNITLSGFIAPYSHYLIERTDDTTVMSVTADLVRSFGTGGLHNDGQVLTLTNVAGNVIDLVNSDGGGWPAGTSTPRVTMERIDPTAPGDDANWADNNGFLTYGWDANGDPLNGTARIHNSVYDPPPLADLHVSQNGPGSVTAGESVTYTLLVQNLGTYTAAATLLTDTLNYYPIPSSTVLLKQEYRAVWDVGALPPAAQQRFTITRSVPLTATGAFVNLVEATTTSTETMRSNNTTVWTTTVQPLSADMAIAKTGPVSATWEDAITYTLTLHNVGQLSAQQCILTDTLPEGLAYVRQETQIPGATFTAAGQTLTWTFGEIGGGTQHVITVGAQVQATALVGVLTNTAAIACAGDANPDNNHAAWPTELVDLRRPHILISGVLYYGYQDGQTDDAVRLTNMSPFPAALENWKLCKNDSIGDLQCRTLPTLLIPALSDVWITGDAAAFAASFGFPADYEMASWLAITNDDELLLRDAEGIIVDALVYNDGMTPFPGWVGPSLRYYSTPKGERGQILARIPDEVTGLPISDTNTAADWLQYTDALTVGKQALYPGWDSDPLFWPLKATEPATVVIGIAPDNAFEVISQTIMQAGETISIEIYALRHPALIDALVQKAEAGVQVTLLLEGDIFGIGGNTPEWQTELYACQQLEATGHGACWFMIHDKDNNIYNRYNFIHAKLVIVDRRWVVVGSQNFTTSGLPADDKANGSIGSRGAVIATTAPSVIARAAEIFAYDCDPAHHNDLLRWNSNPAYADKYGLPLLPPDLSIPDGVSYTVRFPTPLTVSGDFAFELFTAPDAALHQSDALLGLVNRAGAGDTVLVQQAYEYVDWGTDPETAPNLRLLAYLAAARRGAKVRIFVNGKSFVEGYDGPPEDNQATVDYVNQIAAAERLNLKAALGNLTEDGVHNKMVLVALHGDGKYSHVGSINGSESSSKVNREVALQVKSDAVYDYLAAMFNLDWYQTQPIYLPVVLRNYAPPAPPVEYLVVSEVYYSGDANAEWVELYNPTQATVSLSGYQIGDYDGAGHLEGMYTFPANATIPANGVILIAGNGKAVYPYADFELFDHNADIPNLTRVGGDGDWALGNTGDQVLLFNPAGQLGDAVVWGMATYPGIVPHPGVITWTHSLERYPAYYDTDDCSHDFRDRYPPSPGVLPTD